VKIIIAVWAVNCVCPTGGMRAALKNTAVRLWYVTTSTVLGMEQLNEDSVLISP
jgi:hypothetical protein